MSTVDAGGTPGTETPVVPEQPDRRAARAPRALDSKRPAAESQRLGETCPTCHMTKSLTGRCDTCD